MFGEILERKRKEWEERQKERNAWKDWEEEQTNKFQESFFDSYFTNYFLGFLKWMTGEGTPITSFEVLGVSEDSSVDDINSAFRSLAMKHHPDHGGNAEVFRKIVEAKNKCLAYANRENKKDKSETTV